MSSSPDRWLTKDELAARYGLDSVYGVHHKTTSGAWLTYKVLKREVR